MWILHGWSWCRLGWLPVKEQLRNRAVGLTLRYLGHAGTVSHMFLAQPTHSTTATFPWSAIHGPNYIFHHRMFCRAFSKMPDSRCLLFPAPCLLVSVVYMLRSQKGYGQKGCGQKGAYLFGVVATSPVTYPLSSFHLSIKTWKMCSWIFLNLT